MLKKIASDQKALYVEIQKFLTDLGYEPGSIDGIIGPKTLMAINKFLSDIDQEEINYNEDARKIVSIVKMVRESYSHNSPNFVSRELKQSNYGYTLLVEEPKAGSTVIATGNVSYDISDEENMNGIYHYSNDDGYIEGIIDNCINFKKLNYICRWRDGYGQGMLNITFEDDKSAFQGYWKTENSDDKYSWNGTKNTTHETINNNIDDQPKVLISSAKNNNTTYSMPKPSLTGLSNDERSSIKSACILAKSKGPATYNRCLTAQLQELESAPKQPSFNWLK